MNFFGLLRRCGAAGADCPHGLVGDHENLERLGGKLDQTMTHLGFDDIHGFAGVTLGQRLADANQRDQAGGKCGRGFLGHRVVGLAEELAALGVSDDDLGAANRQQHAG